MSNDSEKEAKRIYAIAYQIAEKAHAGQFRNLPDGRPYIEHCKDVASLMPTWELKTVAILHDAIEDTRGEGTVKTRNEKRRTKKAEEKPYQVTEESLLAAGIPKRIVKAVVALTKPKSSKSNKSDKKAAYLRYVKNKVKKTPLAGAVKLVDNYVNMRDMITGIFSGNTGANDCAERLRKYAQSIAILSEPEKPKKGRSRRRKAR